MRASTDQRAHHIVANTCHIAKGVGVGSVSNSTWPSRSLKVIGVGAIQQATYHFLLVFHRNYVTMLYRFRDIVSYFPKFKEVTWPQRHPLRGKSIMHALYSSMCLASKIQLGSKNLKGDMTLTTPLSGIVCHGRLGLVMFNLCTKFQVCSFTRYEHSKGDAKCRNCGGLGYLGITEDYWK